MRVGSCVAGTTVPNGAVARCPTRRSPPANVNLLTPSAGWALLKTSTFVPAAKRSAVLKRTASEVVHHRNRPPLEIYLKVAVAVLV
jgi:hypothetical protein